MFSENTIKKTVEAIRPLWKDYDKLANAYRDYSDRGRGNGHPNTVLKSPEEFEKLLRMTKEEAIKKIFGYGGNGYVSMPQQAERFRWRLCVEFYQHMRAAIPQEVVDYIESLCHMDADDAIYYARKYERAQWDLPTPAAPVKKKNKIKGIGMILLVAAWILLLLYMFQFVKMAFLETGMLFSNPRLFLLIGCLAAGFLTFAQSMYSNEGDGLIFFMLIAAIIFGIMFCAGAYNPGGFFQKVFWMRCLPIIVQIEIFIIAGSVIGAIVRKQNK